MRNHKNDNYFCVVHMRFWALLGLFPKIIFLIICELADVIGLRVPGRTHLLIAIFGLSNHEQELLWKGVMRTD